MKKNTKITLIIISLILLLATCAVITLIFTLNPFDKTLSTGETTQETIVDTNTLSSFSSFLSLTSTTHDSFKTSKLTKDQMYELTAYYIFWGDFYKKENPFIDINSCKTPLKDQSSLMKELEEMNLEPDTVSDYTLTIENFNKIVKAIFGQNAYEYEKEYFNIDLYVNTNLFAKLLYSKTEDALVFEYAAVGGMAIPYCHIDDVVEKDGKMYIDYTIIYYEGHAEDDQQLAFDVYNQVKDFESKQAYLKSIIESDKDHYFTTLTSSITIDKSQNKYTIEEYSKISLEYSSLN